MVSPVEWVSCSHGIVPGHAVAGGRDVDGSPLYIGRAFHHGDMLPAKISPKYGTAYVCYGGAEHTKDNYEVRIYLLLFIVRKCNVCEENHSISTEYAGTVLEASGLGLRCARSNSTRRCPGRLHVHW